MSTENICYSVDDENFNHRTFGDLLDELRFDSDSDEALVGMTYYEASFVNADPMTYLSARTLLEDADDRAGDELGDVYDGDISGVGKEAVEELNALLKAWSDKHCTLSRYWIIVGKSEEKKISKEDLE